MEPGDWTIDDILQVLDRADIDAEQLDDLVLDMHIKDASLVSASGLRGQVEYLSELTGDPRETLRMIARHTKNPVITAPEDI